MNFIITELSDQIDAKKTSYTFVFKHLFSLVSIVALF